MTDPIAGDAMDLDETRTITTRVPRPARLMWDSFGASHAGHVRTINEDNYLDAGEQALWVVADGMGGHAKGDVASRRIIEAFGQAALPAHLSGFADRAETLLLDLNNGFRELANHGRDGVTIGSTTVILTERQGWMLYLWAGDSRIYRLRDGALQQLTQDHSQVEDLIARGLLLRENAESHPAANVVNRAVGADDELYVDMDYCDAAPGDRFLLCSDGLTKELPEIRIREILGDPHGPRAICERLLEATLATAARDNVTVVVCAAQAWKETH